METAVRTLNAYLAEPIEIGEPEVAGPLAVFPLFGPPGWQPDRPARSALRGRRSAGRPAEPDVRPLGPRART